MTAELMDLMSSTSDVDHPVCQDCCEALLDVLEGELQKTEIDLKTYKDLHAKLLKERHQRRSESGKSEIVELNETLEKVCSRSLRSQPGPINANDQTSCSRIIITR
jgi:beclin 1